MTAQLTAGITRGIAKMAVTTRSQAQRQPSGNHPEPPGRPSNRDERMHGTSESSSGDEEPSDHDEETEEEGDDGDDRDDGDYESEEDHMNDENKEPEFIDSTATNIRYNVTELSADEHSRLTVGISPSHEQYPMFMDHCDHPPSSPDSYRFHINDKVRVIVGAEGSSTERPRCSCRDVQGHETCKHIYWLEDQLLGAYHSPGEVITPSSGRSLISESAPAAAITGVGTLEEFARRRHWFFGDQSLSAHEIEQLVSVFRRNSPSLEGRQVLLTTYAKLSQVLVRQARNDFSFTLKLRSLLTPRFVATAFFSDLQFKIGSAFEEFDAGVIADYSEDALAQNVEICAETLRRLIADTEDFFRQHPMHDPEMATPARDGVGALVEMLEQVACRDRSVSTDSVGRAFRVSSQKANAANALYECLIGSRNQSGLSLPVHEFFVVGTLKMITNSHPALMQNNIDRMGKVIEAIRQRGAPTNFLSALENLPLRKRGTSGVGGPEAKRGQ